jgi:hypothetical protein
MTWVILKRKEVSAFSALSEEHCFKTPNLLRPSTEGRCNVRDVPTLLDEDCKKVL